MDENTIKLNRLEQELESLRNEFYRNNFSGQQDFPKYSNFTNHIRIPHYDTRPSTCDVGELIENGGKLYLCSAANTWTEK